jgi:hypothetical protein
MAQLTTADRAIKRAVARDRWPEKHPAMLRFLENLLNDCGFSTRVQRNAWLTSEVDRDIKFLDELTFSEASRLINVLKERKEQDQK